MAAIVWTTTNPAGQPAQRSSKGVAASGTAAFDKGATDGANVDSVGAVFVIVSADVGQTINADTGKLLCWHYNDVSGNWARAPDWDLTIPVGSTGNREVVLKGPSTGFGIPVPCARGRIAFAPSAVPLSAGGCTIYINCARWQASQGDGTPL